MTTTFEAMMQDPQPPPDSEPAGPAEPAPFRQALSLVQVVMDVCISNGWAFTLDITTLGASFHLTTPGAKS